MAVTISMADGRTYRIQQFDTPLDFYSYLSIHTIKVFKVNDNLFINPQMIVSVQSISNTVPGDEDD